jgi:conjugal transfer mating pair stabilization protein TraN
MAYGPVHGYLSPVLADQNPYSGEAEEWTKEFSDSIWSDASTDGNNTISVGSGGTKIEGELSDIFPGMKGGSDVAPSTSPSATSLGSVHRDDDAMESMGNSAKSGLYDDAIKDEHIKADPAEVSDPNDLPWSDSKVSQAKSTKYGVAYDIIREDSERPVVDLRDDPIFDNYRDAKDGAPVFEENFFDCSEDNSLTETSRSVHIPDYKMCSRLYKPDGACTIEHSIEIGTEPTDLVFLVDNSGSMGPVIADLRMNVKYFAQLLQQGKSENLRMGGAAIRESDYTFDRVGLSYNIDNFQNWVDGVDAVSAMTYPVDAVNWAMNYYPWRTDPEVNRVIVLIGNEDPARGNTNAVVQRAKQLGIDIFLFHDDSSTNKMGSKIANNFSGQKLIEFAKFFTVVTDHWKPKDCIDDAIASMEEFCDGGYQASPQDDSQCRTISMFNVCKGDHIYEQLKEPPLPNVPKLATHVQVDPLKCDFNHGSESCWTDPQGNYHCLENYADLPESECEQLEKDPQCGFISQECVGNAEGKHGNCYVTEEKWDCGESVEIESGQVETSYQCDGDFQCIGPDCFDTTVEPNTDFAKVSALLNAAQSAQQDMICEPSTGTDSSTRCTLFQGDDMECKEAVGGVQDCCDQPVGVSPADYLKMMIAVPKIDSSIMAAKLTDTSSALGKMKSGYEALRNPLVEPVKEAVQPFTSYVDTLTSEIKDSLYDSLDQVVGKLKEKASELTAEVIQVFTGEEQLAEQAGQAAASEVGEQGAQQAGQQLVSFGATMFAIYGYYQLAMTLIKIIWACEEDEFMLAAQRELNNCHYVGSYCKTKVLGVCVEKRRSYCCYKSPLARIMNEQIREASGLGWGSAENPSCGGIPLDTLDSVDWDNINLDEWTAMLQKEGLYQGASDNLSLEALTGEGSALPGSTKGGERDDLFERTEKRSDGIDFEDQKFDAMKSFEADVQ